MEKGGGVFELGDGCFLLISILFLIANKSPNHTYFFRFKFLESVEICGFYVKTKSDAIRGHPVFPIARVLQEKPFANFKSNCEIVTQPTIFV